MKLLYQVTAWRSVLVICASVFLMLEGCRTAKTLSPGGASTSPSGVPNSATYKVYDSSSTTRPHPHLRTTTTTIITTTTISELTDSSSPRPPMPHLKTFTTTTSKTTITTDTVGLFFSFPLKSNSQPPK